MEEDLLRRKNILNIVLIGSITMLVILDAIVLFYSLRDGIYDTQISFGVFSLLPAFFLFLYAVSRRGYSILASYLLIAGYFLSNSYAAYRWGASLQVVILAYAFIIIMATILRGTKFGFFITGVIAAFISFLWYAQLHDILPAMQKQEIRSADGIVFAVLYFLIMTIAWLYDREIEKSLLRAHTSENELKQQRDQLEITVEERTKELRRTQFEKIEQLNRFAEMGQLSSGLFHDVFNLLNAISLRSEGDQSEYSLANAFKTTKQIENFTQGIRKQLSQNEYKENFSLSESIEHVVQLLAYKANREHIRIIINQSSPKDIRYFNTPYKFHQVLLNLLLNAIESFDDLPLNDARQRSISLTLEEHHGIVTLSVQDNGSGIAPEVITRIFEEFFTTKKSSKGIGIGLATIKKVLEENLNGTIAVRSEADKGSTFTITFPLNNGSAHEDNPESP